MKLINLTGARGGQTRVDDSDYAALLPYKWHSDGFRVMRGYWDKQTKKYRSQTMHRQLLVPPVGLVVDHINGDVLDNQRANLRICTRALNARNAGIKTKNRRYKGTYFIHGRWVAQIRINKKLKTLGRFATEREAVLAYNAGALKYHGDFARLNLL